MNRRQLEKLKIPESVRVPILGGKIYQYLVRKENDLIQTESIHKSALNSEKRTEKVIASMTSFPDSFHLWDFFISPVQEKIL